LRPQSKENDESAIGQTALSLQCIHKFCLLLFQPGTAATEQPTFYHSNELKAYFFDITSIFLRYFFDLIDRRNIEEITNTFRKNKFTGIYRLRDWLEYNTVLPCSCEEWIISEFLEDVVLNQSFKRDGYSVG
jgi:hypothetical protein